MDTNIKNAPPRIYLNVGDLPPGELEFKSLHEVTWCADRQSGNDLEYVLAAPSAAAAIEPQATVKDGERAARAIRLLEIAEPILEAAAAGKAVTIAAGDLLRLVRAFVPDEEWDEAGAPEWQNLCARLRAKTTIYDGLEPIDILQPSDLQVEAANLIESVFTRAAVTQAQEGWAAGVEAAAKLLDKNANDYARQFGYDDMGSLSFGQGAHADAKRDHHWSLIELAEDLRAMRPDVSAVPAALKAGAPFRGGIFVGSYSEIEDALDKAGAPMHDGARWLTFPERIATLVAPAAPGDDTRALVDALTLECEKFWWNDGPEGKSPDAMNAAKAAVLAALAVHQASRTDQPAALTFEQWARNEGLIHESHGVRSVNSMCGVAEKAWNAALTTAPQSAAKGSERAEFEALRKIVQIADREPFEHVGHVIEHWVPDARAAVARAAARDDRRGIYAASRASIQERPDMWKRLRSDGWPIVSTWIDEAGEGETSSFEELWCRIFQEIQSSCGVLLYAENEDFPLKGALIECGIALGLGKPVAVVLPDVPLSPRSMKPIGSWVRHPLVTICNSLDAARDFLLASAVLSADVTPPSTGMQAQPGGSGRP